MDISVADHVVSQKANIAMTPNHNRVSDPSQIISERYISTVISDISVSDHVESQKANIIAIRSRSAKYDSPATQNKQTLLGKT